MMDLREPKEKKRVRLQAHPSLPISFNDDGELRMYTAYLSASGTCIVDPCEMEAVYLMGFFGKGSLSRSFPSFGKTHLGAPSIIRNRQWIRRQKWLEELENLNKESNRKESEDMGHFMQNSTCDSSLRQSLEEESGDDTMTIENETDRINDVKLTGEASSDKTAVTLSSKILLAPEDTAEKEIDNNSSIEMETNSWCDKKSDKLNANASVDLKTISINARAENDLIELVEMKTNKEQTPHLSGKVSVILENTADKEICNEPSKACKSNLSNNTKPEELDSKSPETLKKAVDVLDQNSSIEFIADESAIKKARMENPKKIDVDIEITTSNHDEKGTSMIRDESTKFDEVLLDSTEEEEVCEIVEKPHDLCSNDEEGDEDSIIEEETNLYEVLVVPDTDSDTDNYLKNVKPRIEKEGFPVNETLHLTFEETFFLMYGLGCLQLIHYDGSIFSINNAWNHFQQQDQYYIQKYVVYHYFRSKGWVVKPGLKFGGDFLLYKKGPPFYHASYIVVIEVMDADTLIRDDVKSPRKLTWKNLIGMERLSETIAKEILFAQILWPSSIVRNGNLMPIEFLSEFTVRELLWRRWDPRQKVEMAVIDKEESDSS